VAGSGSLPFLKAPELRPETRTFLFLQGPHGPFFRQLARTLRAAGAATFRVGFNRGDAVFWGDRRSYLAETGPPATWPARIAGILAARGVTDLVVYGDTRPVHAEAIAAARANCIRVHVFEEGYLRPYWVTYERGGANANSPVMHRGMEDIDRALRGRDAEMFEAPAHWGDLRQHVFYGALYHGLVLVANRAYAEVPPHRGLSVAEEFRLYLRRLALMPAHAAERALATRRVTRGGFPYHLALLQLEHDASFRDHGPFGSQAEFVDAVIAGFAEGAPGHHHLVFKAHPLEDGRLPVRAVIRRIAAARGVADRVHFLRGGKLARLLDDAASAVTVNSTAGQQALWRGLPLRCFGQAVYARPGFVSDQALAEFFRDPAPPDAAAYRRFRQYLLETSQIPGSYYAARGRRRLLRRVADLMLSPGDAYEALDEAPDGSEADAVSADRQHLRLLR
jgi:capsular polysaccharide export protein